MSAELGGAILKSVSRSFYITLRALPRGLREPVSLAYLLARASDTIADSTNAPAEVRLKHLRAFGNMIEEGAKAENLHSLSDEIIPADPSERRLIKRAGDCLAWLQATPEADRDEIRAVLRPIIRGQELDVVRFGDSGNIVALTNSEELEEYTYLVAGCVGEFWTRIAFRHVRNYARLDLETMCKLGCNFGKGLQLVNILRDLPADLRAGRCFLPGDELARAVVGPDEVLSSTEKAKPVVEFWLARAETYLADAQVYIEALRHRLLRFACLVPWAIGVRTLALLHANPPLETARRIKVTRGEVHRILLRAGASALGRSSLESWRHQLAAVRNARGF
ncbi:MAG: farnesyl-diphosphate farnesyltransferase [Chthoniobacter sp.]|jgi:farnesyl-diphosphate farnesyltransferase|nr:farnesyl-diphosphate farnesyltransferase [Chthoniobacter sp.]